MASSNNLRQRAPGDPVLERLDDLRRDSVRAERVYQYVATGHEADATVTDLLHVIRADDELALELRASTGRDVIAAVDPGDGEIRYAVYEYSAVAAKMDGRDPEDYSWAARSDAKQLLEGRQPRVRLREDTTLADLEATGEVYRGP